MADAVHKDQGRPGENPVSTLVEAFMPANDELTLHAGYCTLGRVVKELGLSSHAPVEVDYVVSGPDGEAWQNT